MRPLLTSRPTRRAILLAAAVVALVPRTALGQGLPAKPIRIIVPYPAGGPTDALARIVAAELQADLGQPVVVENKAGASGAIGTREAAKAVADASTLVLGTNQTHVTNAFLLREPGYDPVNDFTPVSGLADLQHILVVSKALGVATLDQLLTILLTEPGRLQYGSTGAGSASHLTMELFKSRIDIEIRHVAFGGSAPLTAELIAGRIDLSFATLPTVLSQIQGGQIVALGVASARRAPQLPELPTLKEQGVNGAESDAWLALFAPAATPPAVLDRLQASIAKALAKPEVRANAIARGISVNLRDRPAFSAYQADEIKKWAAVIAAANVKPAD